jgi:hypothetical protein
MWPPGDTLAIVRGANGLFTANAKQMVKQGGGRIVFWIGSFDEVKKYLRYE